ncbi:MAG: serine acetyltransferase [Planctomycetes bacterium]|nr:serine acetyltransferase [Planctomycetota bacterium]MBU1518268.1 serine acetyltransferase [Planctomycetota bacterium]MBU2457017.1 serine acetyltransferase [Planctomycetota bacterium]MBU2596422.1 serine acetyltransferase [Planctomycetota bacterium]
MENDGIKKFVKAIVDTYEDDSGINFIDTTNLPLRDRILEILDLLTEVVFPGYTGVKEVTSSNIGFVVGDILCKIQSQLNEQIERALLHQCRLKQCDGASCHIMAQDITEYLLNRLADIRNLLKTDIQAAFDGDPAASSFEEIVLSYPGLRAITTHRIAHELYLKKVPLIPRIISERAHHETGIDIHPGARIGERFFIDHGTGIVIGETAVIGNNVKIYQGVTLGALALAKGQSLRGVKRHPTIEDDVTIYAAATILGDITIGKGAIIGGNVWIKDSVPPGVIVSMSKAELVYIQKKSKK